jgi:Skp family chaperone for outer membrane proteins
MKARVVWVQRPSNYRDQFHIAVEFDVPGNVWGIAVPPENWFPHPEDIELEIPVTEPVELGSFGTSGGPSGHSTPYSSSFTSSIETIERPVSSLGKQGSLPHLTAVTTMVAEAPKSALNAEKTVLAMPRKEALAASVAAESGVQHLVKEILAKELGTFRTQIATEVREAVSEAMQTLLTAESAAALTKIQEQSSKGVAAVTEQAQKALREITGELDEKIKSAVETAIAASPELLQAPKPRTPRKSSKRKTKTEAPPEI